MSLFDIGKGAAASLFVFLAVQGAGANAAEWDTVCAKLIKRRGSELGTREAMAVSRAMVRSGFKAHALLQKEKPGSLVTSPFSILSMFGMLLNGSEANTFNEIAAGFDLPSSLQANGLPVGNSDQVRRSFNRGYEAIASSLQKVNVDSILAYGNIAVVDNRFSLNPVFIEDVQKNLGATSENWDFSDPAVVVRRLNDYIEAHTRDMIKDLLQPDDAPDKWALVNASYFKAPWEILFDVNETDENALFHLADGSTKQVPMMNLHPKIPYYNHAVFQMVSLPYKDADFAMDLFVPKGDKNPDDVLALVGDYEAWLAQAKPTELDLGLPRWEIESQLKEEMVAVFSKLMPSVFNNADFSRMLKNAPPMGHLVHAAVTKTNELGSEGAAVTYGGGVECVRPPDPSVVADRPFLAVIRHVPTGIPLFLISEWNPKPLPKPGPGENSQARSPFGEDPVVELAEAFVKAAQKPYTLEVVFYQYYRIRWANLAGNTLEEKVASGFRQVKAQRLDSTDILEALRKNFPLVPLADALEAYLRD